MGAGIGGVVFLKLEARRLFNEVADDPSLRTIARQSFVYHEMNRTPGFRKSVIWFAKMSSGVYRILRNADIRLPGKFISEPVASRSSSFRTLRAHLTDGAHCLVVSSCVVASDVQNGRAPI